MYRRLKNRFDLEMIKDKLQTNGVNKAVTERVSETLGTLDLSYGADRTSTDMGGYVLLFEDRKDYEKSIDKILNFYHVNKEEYEYTETIADNWEETLYLLSSDDSLVLVYPKGA